MEDAIKALDSLWRFYHDMLMKQDQDSFARLKYSLKCNLVLYALKILKVCDKI